MLLISLGVLFWLAVLVTVLGICGVAAEADARGRRPAVAARGRRPRAVTGRARAPMRSEGSRHAALR